MKENLAEKELVISLIKDDLTNIRLVLGLEKLGLDSGKYYLNLFDTIIDLLGIDENEDKCISEYLTLAEKVLAPEIFRDPEKLEALAQTIYAMLIQSKDTPEKTKK